MLSGSLGENIELGEELIKKACKLAFKAHLKHPEKQYIYQKNRSSTDAVFAFAGTWSVEDWYIRKPFGETKISKTLFPSLRSIGNDVEAGVNEAFARRFEEILIKSSLASEVEKAASDRKQIVFTGHSSGGPIAILVALWFFEKYIRPANIRYTPPFCVTFGSPLSVDRLLSHALRRENWAHYFIHFVMRYDIVPRIMLAPYSSIEQGLQQILAFLNPKSQYFRHESIGSSSDAYAFFVAVLRNASTAASHAACQLMECTNLLVETISSFISLSPYRPFGTYVFCTGNGQLVVIDNPDAVLQVLFYCCQLGPEEGIEVAYRRSLNEHLVYESALQDSLEMQNVFYLNSLLDIPLSSNACMNTEAATTHSALNDLGLSERARLCLRAAGESEKQKQKNQEKIDSNKDKIREGLKKIQEYKTKCDVRKIGYYDAFKLQKDISDFEANVNRLKLAGIWDEIIEMLKRYDLPDRFEGRKEWIELGTRFRRSLEPLDIANYYRHLKNDDTGPYMRRGRPNRYKFTQRWLDHAERMPVGSIAESSFWAEVEELRALASGGRRFLFSIEHNLASRLVKSSNSQETSNVQADQASLKAATVRKPQMCRRIKSSVGNHQLSEEVWKTKQRLEQYSKARVSSI